MNEKQQSRGLQRSLRSRNIVFRGEIFWISTMVRVLNWRFIFFEISHNFWIISLRVFSPCTQTKWRSTALYYFPLSLERSLKSKRYLHCAFFEWSLALFRGRKWVSEWSNKEPDEGSVSWESSMLNALSWFFLSTIRILRWWFHRQMIATKSKCHFVDSAMRRIPDHEEKAEQKASFSLKV